MEKHYKRLGIGCGVILVAAILGFLVYVFLLGRALDRSQQPVTDTAQYPAIRAAWPSNLVAHFPAALPQTAIFHFHPGLLQGGAAVQARVTMREDQCAALLASCSGSALGVYQGGNVNEHANVPNGLPTTFFYTSGTQELKFPDDFTILVLVAVNRDRRDHWNHGDSSGIAVSTQRHEVVYWAESW